MVQVDMVGVNSDSEIVGEDANQVKSKAECEPEWGENKDDKPVRKQVTGHL